MRKLRESTDRYYLHNGVDSKVVWVTPEMAREWLKKNACNRKIHDKAVSEYAKDMLDENWFCSNDAITFDEDGMLTNGQHRLLAIIKSGPTQQFLVAHGIEHNVNMDRGAARTIADNLRIFTDLPSQCSEKPVVSMCNFILDSLGYNIKNGHLIAGFLEEYKIPIVTYFTEIPTGSSTKYASGPCLAAFFLAYLNGVPLDMLKRMKEALITREYDFPGYDLNTFKPMIYLARAADRLASRTRREKQELFRRSMSAINNTMTGKGGTTNRPARRIIYNIEYCGKALS